jgi:polyphosphate kinase
LLTRDDAITSAVHDVFNYLTAYAEHNDYKPLLVAPRDMAKTCIGWIEREARHARRGRPARIIVKVNAIVDPPVIRALYKASQAGVEIDLIVRGHARLCRDCGESAAASGFAVLGRLLEHSRIFYFENGGKPEIHLGSADWMPRNLYERVEVLFPLKDSRLFERISAEILPSYLADTRKARILGPDGTYSRPRAVRNGHGFSVQEHLMQLAAGVGDAQRTAVLRGPGVVFTSKGAAADSASPEADSTAQDTLNAAV